MIDQTPSPDFNPIFIVDRGFYYLNIFAHTTEHDSYFLSRAKYVNMRRLHGSEFPAEDCFDIQINRILTRLYSKKKWLLHELEEQYQFICKTVPFDYVEPNGGERISHTASCPLF